MSSPQLRAGALGLSALLMQGVTHIAPAVGLLLSIQFISQLAGAAAPLCYAIAFLIVLTLGLSLVQLARHFPSAGGYYTYVSRTVHPQAGFLTAWMYFLYDPTSTAINLTFAGYFFQQAAATELGVHLPWWAVFLGGALLVTVLCYRGIELSSRLMALFCVVEVGIVLCLCTSGLLHPGPAGAGGLLGPLLPRSASSLSGLALGVVFSLFCFTGFESLAPLAEESRDPKKNLPRGMLGSILLMGAFFVFASWALLIAWGPGELIGFQRSVESPPLVLARRLWGGGRVLLLVAVANSLIGVCIACTNASTRVFYAMGRTGSLPRGLARVHPRYRTPTAAILLQTVVTLAVGLGLGLWLGPAETFFFMGVAITLGLSVVYVAGNVGVVRYYLGEGRAELRPLVHLACPLLSTLALIVVGYKSVVPLPPAPVRYAPVLVLGWLVLGLIWMAARRFRA